MTKLVYPISSVTGGSELESALIRLYTEEIYRSVLCTSPSDRFFFFSKIFKSGLQRPGFGSTPPL